MTIIRLKQDRIHRTPANRPSTLENDDESSMSGHMPDPESDDDVLEEAHRVGLYTEIDHNAPVELNIARELREGEGSFQESDTEDVE